MNSTPCWKSPLDSFQNRASSRATATAPPSSSRSSCCTDASSASASGAAASSALSAGTATPFAGKTSACWGAPRVSRTLFNASIAPAGSSGSRRTRSGGGASVWRPYMSAETGSLARATTPRRMQQSGSRKPIASVARQARNTSAMSRASSAWSPAQIRITMPLASTARNPGREANVVRLSAGTSMPCVTSNACPANAADSSLARNTAALATSSGFGNRLTGAPASSGRLRRIVPGISAAPFPLAAPLGARLRSFSIGPG